MFEERKGAPTLPIDAVSLPDSEDDARVKASKNTLVKMIPNPFERPKVRTQDKAAPKTHPLMQPKVMASRKEKEATAQPTPTIKTAQKGTGGPQSQRYSNYVYNRYNGNRNINRSPAARSGTA